MNIKLIRECVFWSSEVWSRPFIEYLENNQSIKDLNTFLELGAGEYSSLSPYFLSLGKKTTCSYFYSEKSKYYAEDSLRKIRLRNDYLIEKYEIEGEIEYKRIDIFELEERYDIIFLKSILGGLYRYDESDIKEVNNLIEIIRNNNLSKNGHLITIDNGKSLFEKPLEDLGLRKNKWRYFNSSDLVNYDQEYSFGFTTVFSLRTRNLFLGNIVERLLYIVDLIIAKLFHNRYPTVILKVFRRLELKKDPKI
tara:strand:+ start:1045 stop:1797 length:753 start_codon:yes stop_codon:yes gene_type:complete